MAPPSTRSFTPGKVILSGEHAVVHGRPALAMCVERGVYAQWTPVEEPTVEICLPGTSPVRRTIPELRELSLDVQDRHQAFLRGDLPVAGITDGPETLLLTALYDARPQTGGKLEIESSLPLGSGMGSSAACLLSLFRAVRPEWNDSTLFDHALACEHLQHGRSSGLDVAVCLSGSAVWAENGTFSPLPNVLPANVAFYHTGKPQSSTGECVSAVADRFPAPHPIWEEFEAVTKRFRTEPHLSPAIQENHRLLSRIGVVPEPIQEAVDDIEANGGAAKICGAGSIRGAAAGVIMVMNPPGRSIPDTWTCLQHS